MKKENNEQEKFIYIGIIIILIGILTIRVFNQGEKINKSIDKIKEEGISIEYQQEKKEKRDKISLSKTFESKNKKISLKFPPDWQKIEDNQVLKLFNPGTDQGSRSVPEIENINPEELKKLENITNTSTENKEKLEGEIILMAMKSKVPQFSLGVISIQKLELSENNLSTLEKEMQNEFQKETGNSKSRIIKKEKGGDYILMEVVTSINGRDTFKSKNVGFKKNEEIFLFAFNSTYDSWKDFKNEFDLILSSIEFQNE